MSAVAGAATLLLSMGLPKYGTLEVSCLYDGDHDLAGSSPNDQPVHATGFFTQFRFSFPGSFSEL